MTIQTATASLAKLSAQRNHAIPVNEGDERGLSLPAPMPLHIGQSRMPTTVPTDAPIAAPLLVSPASAPIPAPTAAPLVVAQAAITVEPIMPINSNAMSFFTLSPRVGYARDYWL
jgi:hypothetical protein